MAKRTQHTIGLDIGTSRVTCIAGEPGEGGLLEVVGIGEAEARGLRKGVIVNPDAAVDAIKKAVEEAERMSGLRSRRGDDQSSRLAHPWLQRSGDRRRVRSRSRNHRRRRAPRNRFSLCDSTSGRTRNRRSPAAGIHRRRSGRHQRSGRNDRRAAGSESPHRHQSGYRAAERHQRRESRRAWSSPTWFWSNWPPPKPR